MKYKKILDVLKYLWIVIVVSAAGYFFYRNYDKFVSFIKDISIFPLILSFFFITVGKVILAEFTRLSLKKIGYKLSFKDAIKITGMTQLGKYIPGGVWQFAGKLGIYKIRGYKFKLAAKAMIFENYWLLSSALAIGALLVLEFNNQSICKYVDFICPPLYSNLLKILIVLLWIGSSFIVSKILFKGKNVKISYDDLIVFFYQLLTWFLSGISFWILFYKQYSFISLFQTIGAFSISWAMGFMVFFASGGIGIRELFLTLTLSNIIPPEQILIIASIHRLLWILSDLLVGLGSSIFFGIPINKEIEESNDAAPTKWQE